VNIAKLPELLPRRSSFNAFEASLTQAIPATTSIDSANRSYRRAGQPSVGDGVRLCVTTAHPLKGGMQVRWSGVISLAAHWRVDADVL
jgi:hypothetical protein